MTSKLATFFATHPVFTVPDLDAFLAQEGTLNAGTRQALLTHHLRQGHVLRVRRGLYAAVDAASDARTAFVDPLLVASRLAEDAVLAYHAAVSFHGHAHSVRSEYPLISEKAQADSFRFQGNTFRITNPPAPLERAGVQDFAVEAGERRGLPVRVTSLERTLVDCLDRPQLGGGWEEIWRSFEGVGYLDLDQIVAYVSLLGNSVVAAKVGYFLEQHRDAFSVSARHLDALRNLRPRQARYLGADRDGARYVPAWNIMIPLALLRQTIREAL